MIRIQSEIKRGILRQIAEGAKASALTLKSALIMTQGQATDAALKKGRVMVSVSGNGQTTSFQISSSGFTQDVFVGLMEQLINVLDDTVTAGTPDGTTAPVIDTLFAAMAADDRLAGVRTLMGDYTTLRFPVTR